MFGKIKCYFCGEKNGIMQSVCDYDIYGAVGKRVHYHQECLELVEREVEKCGHIMADKAIHINDQIERCKKFNDRIEPEFIKKVKTLHRFNFERLMPKKR